MEQGRGGDRGALPTPPAQKTRTISVAATFITAGQVFGPTAAVSFNIQGVERYANTMVKGTSSSTSWYVSKDLYRLTVRDTASKNRLTAGGVAGPYTVDSATLSLLVAMSGKYVATSPTFKAGDVMRRGMQVKSSDGRYRFAMQTDGNLVLYGPSGRAVWSTDQQVGWWRYQEYVVFQTDGNMVSYGGGQARWDTRTQDKGANRFVVQSESDGNMVVYAGSKALWASGTYGRT